MLESGQLPIDQEDDADFILRGFFLRTMKTVSKSSRYLVR